MKYKALKTIHAETLLRCNPCELAFKEYIAKFGILSPNFEEFIEWAEENGHINWLLDKEFIEEIEGFKPVTITLNSQDVVDKLYAILNFTPIIGLIDKEENFDSIWQYLDVYKSSKYNKYHDILHKNIKTN